jgi:hypothetical protein
MAALSVGNAATLQEQYVAEHKILTKSYNDYLGIEEVGKDLFFLRSRQRCLGSD